MQVSLDHWKRLRWIVFENLLYFTSVKHSSDMQRLGILPDGDKESISALEGRHPYMDVPYSNQISPATCCPGQFKLQRLVACCRKWAMRIGVFLYLIRDLQVLHGVHTFLGEALRRGFHAFIRDK